MRIPCRSLSATALLLVCAAAPLLAQTDSVPRKPDSAPSKPFFTWRDVAILEAFAIATVAIAPLDTRLANRLQDATFQENRFLRNTAHFVENVTDPGAFLIGTGLYVYGKLRDNQRAADVGLHGIEALLIGSQLGMVMKGVIGRARPYVDVNEPHDYKLFRGFGKSGDFRSFPSGHTIAAFSAASLVTSETKRWWPKSVWVIGPIMYGGAWATGWSRMYDNKHWASDVITGAAIGTFTGLKVAHFHHVYPDNWIDRTFLGASVTPTPDGAALLRLSFRPSF
jgi:membrane-associated phospholipid phosphatase